LLLGLPIQQQTATATPAQYHYAATAQQ